MPFQSLAQQRKCWAQYHRDIKAGRIPSWDCRKWSAETKGKKLPDRKLSSKKQSYKASSRKTSLFKLSPKKDMRKRKLHIGPRGGKYVIFRGKKVYV